MLAKQVTRFYCEICGSEHMTPEAAEFCESWPIYKPSGLKPGDVITYVVYLLDGHKPRKIQHRTATVKYLTYDGTDCVHEERVVAERHEGGGEVILPSYNCTKIKDGAPVCSTQGM